jgi:transcription initiation factor TFIIB
MSRRHKRTDLADIVNSFNDKPSEWSASHNGKCKTCNVLMIVSDEGFNTCSICGIISKSTIDQTAEWRFFGSDDCQSGDPSRCGMPINPLLYVSSLSCKVLPGKGSSYEMLKIRRYTEYQSMPYVERSRNKDFQWIVMMGTQSGIPKLILDESLYYYKMISEFRTFRGLNRDGIIAASLYVAARVNQYPRTSHEIALIFNLDTSSATKGCKRAITIINDIESTLSTSDKISMKQTTPMSFIERFCSKLHIPQDIIKICTFASMRVHNNNLIPENTPQSIAAGIIYFVVTLCKVNVIRKDVSIVSDISEVTINKCHKKLLNIKTDIIPQMILNKYV